ncbi:MAG: ATP-binding cassette domain-containing protein [Actinobacteria bacterium]|nr:ATP-binding cassette domain-containing protein [Actinomycetota bacterium]
MECRQLRRAFGGVQALDGVDFSISRDEIVGLAGANGAGKSTLLNAIGGQLRIDGGTIKLSGAAIERFGAHKVCQLGVGRTFQDARVYSSLTVLENVALAVAYAETSRLGRWVFGQRRLGLAMQQLRRVALDDRAQQVSGRLSVYEKKRLMLACALASRPSLLLLDEPAGGLSPEEVQATVALCQSVKREGTAIVVVEHIMSFLSALADRVVILHEGKVLFEGSPAQVSHEPIVRAAWLGEASRGERQ